MQDTETVALIARLYYEARGIRIGRTDILRRRWAHMGNHEAQALIQKLRDEIDAQEKHRQRKQSEEPTEDGISSPTVDSTCGTLQHDCGGGRRIMRKGDPFS